MKYRKGIVGLPVLRAGTMVLAAAGVLGIAAVAAAQPAPPPVPPPVPPSATAPTDPNAPPPPTTAAPQTPPPVDPNAPPATPPVDPNIPPAPVDPNAPPAATQPVQPPAVEPPPAPPPAVQPTPAPPPQPTLQWSPTVGGPGRDTVTPGSADAKGPTKPLPWRGTTFTWDQSGTTTIFGVGRDNVGSESESYGWEFLFEPNYYILDLEKDKIRVLARVGWTTELTNSDTTTDRNETLFEDLQLGLGYTRTIFESGGSDAGEYLTTGTLTGRFVLPTSEASIDQGRYLSTSLALGAKQQVKILGTKAAGLKNATLGVTGTWGHLFSRYYEGFNGDLHFPRQSNRGETLDSGVIDGRSLNLNQLTAALTIDLNLVDNLSLTSRFRVIGKFKHDFESGGSAPGDCDLTIQNKECVTAGRLEDRDLYQPDTTFDLALTYPIYEVVDLTLGYNNEARWIGEDSKRRSIFYSPEAEFYFDIVANLDVVYTKVAGAVTGKKQAPTTTAKTAKSASPPPR